MFKVLSAAALVLAIAVFAVAYSFGLIFNPSPSTPVAERSIYDFTMKDIDGTDVPVASYRGKVLMIVNTASKCGYTPQYEQLEALYQTYKHRGFVVLGFPANNFLGQEPGTDKEIKEFCTFKYKVTFPMFAKISVKGADQHSFYNFLTHKETNPGFDGDITWNFEKFLADKDGKIIARFPPKTEPNTSEVAKITETALSR